MQCLCVTVLPLLDSDSAGKTESVALIKKGYSVFLWAKVFDHLSKRFPKDRKLIFQIKDINDLFKYMYAKDSNLNFEQFNLFLDDYFSNSALDLLFV